MLTVLLFLTFIIIIWGICARYNLISRIKNVGDKYCLLYTCIFLVSLILAFYLGFELYFFSSFFFYNDPFPFLSFVPGGLPPGLPSDFESRTRTDFQTLIKKYPKCVNQIIKLTSLARRVRRGQMTPEEFKKELDSTTPPECREQYTEFIQQLFKLADEYAKEIKSKTKK